MDGNRILGDRIKERRIEKGFTQETLADAVAVHFRTIGDWEKGKGCKSEHIPNLCKVLDCDTEYLFGYCATPHKETASVMYITGLSEKAVDLLIDNKRATVRPKENDIIQAMNAVIESKIGLHFLSTLYDYIFGDYQWVNLFGDDSGSSKISAPGFQFQVFEKGTFCEEVYSTEDFRKMLRNSKMAKMQELLIKLRDEMDERGNSSGEH